MWRNKYGRWVAAAFSSAAIFFGVLMMLYWGTRFILPHNYTYVEMVAAGSGVKLHALAVRPEDVELRAADRPLARYHVYGINGGFFDGDAVLSIAMNDDKPVQGKAGNYGSGWFNAKYARGTLVWDEVLNRFTVQVVSSAAELDVADRTRYFAQGGVSMNLRDDAGWRAAVEAEHLPNPDEDRLRSGLVYDDAGRLWLIVTPTRCTAEEFRSAIKEAVAPGAGKEGIFLDGDGSAQMNAAETRLHGDSREIRQMIAIR